MSNVAGGKPQILFLAQTLPYPPDGGVQIRTYNIFRLLARQYHVHALCFYRRAIHPTAPNVERSVAALNELGRVEAFPIPQEHSRPQLLLDHLRSVISGRVYTVHAYRSDPFRRRLRDLVRTGEFELVHMDSLDLSGYLPEVDGVPTICTHHNIESELLRRRAAQQSGTRRSYLRHQAGLMLREEARWAPRVALNVAVSPADAVALQEIAPGARVQVVPNGVDTQLFRPRADGEDGIVFVGGYTWFPNRDALHYFATEILPVIRSQKGPRVPVRWLGRAPEHVRERYRLQHGIELTGYVDSIQPHVGRAACYVVPLRVGGGTRLKVLDAWAMGKAVVSTSVGCEGLDARDGENILIRDDPAEFAAAVSSVLTDASLRTRLGHAARQTAEEQYDWEVIGRSMIPAYEKLLSG